ncbi:DUF3240 family protein [Curvibacter sp. RS43]|uniref:DUF3240 family protein n=1 Tax=Curvibacter microcysteis TaxID=3026419 RepID=UPI002361C110|nr:DUF3240 family protein [Curvibacter sp. RS43]MDD0811090.1 DUF3240 family protein [Curvibacter sp. RS43]
MTTDFTAPTAALCLLTLSLPPALEESLLDALQTLPALGPTPGPFTVWQGQLLGPGVALLSAMEQVQGRAKRSLVQLPLPPADVPAVVQALRDTLRHPDVHWWSTPVLAHGSLA